MEGLAAFGFVEVVDQARGPLAAAQRAAAGLPSGPLRPGHPDRLSGISPPGGRGGASGRHQGALLHRAPALGLAAGAGAPARGRGGSAGGGAAVRAAVLRRGSGCRSDYVGHPLVDRGPSPGRAARARAGWAFPAEARVLGIFPGQPGAGDPAGSGCPSATPRCSCCEEGRCDRVLVAGHGRREYPDPGPVADRPGRPGTRSSPRPTPRWPSRARRRWRRRWRTRPWSWPTRSIRSPISCSSGSARCTGSAWSTWSPSAKWCPSCSRIGRRRRPLAEALRPLLDPRDPRTIAPAGGAAPWCAARLGDPGATDAGGGAGRRAADAREAEGLASCGPCRTPSRLSGSSPATWRIRTEHEERWRALLRGRSAHRVPALARGAAAAPLAPPGPGRRDRGERGARRPVPGRLRAPSLGYRPVRGSSTRGGARALLGAVRELQAGHSVAFTPDGPRGPRRELKPGVVAAAQRGGAVIVPVHAEAESGLAVTFVGPVHDSQARRPGHGHATARPFEVAPGEVGAGRRTERRPRSGWTEIARRAPMRRRGDTHRVMRWLWTSRRPDARLARLALLPVVGALAGGHGRPGRWRTGEAGSRSTTCRCRRWRSATSPSAARARHRSRSGSRATTPARGLGPASCSAGYGGDEALVHEHAVPEARRDRRSRPGRRAPSGPWPTARRCWCSTTPISGSMSAATSTSLVVSAETDPGGALAAAGRALARRAGRRSTGPTR